MSFLLPEKIASSDPLVLNIIDKAVEAMLSTGFPEKIYIFGSWARGNFTEASDLDFAVIVNLPNEVKEFYQKFTSTNLGWPLDVLAFPKAYFNSKSKLGGVCMIIAEEGTVLFEKNPRP